MRFRPTQKWAQLYTIFIYVNGAFIPAVVFASSKRTAVIYEAAFKEIKDYIQRQLERTWAPKVNQAH
jgi:hypothetical protein